MIRAIFYSASSVPSSSSSSSLSSSTVSNDILGLPRTMDEIQLEKYLQNLQLWADWYTIVRAEQVLHSVSDFSRSAVHWVNNPTAYTIQQYDEKIGKFLLQREPWVTDTTPTTTGGTEQQQQPSNTMKPLSQRIKPDYNMLMHQILNEHKKVLDIETEHPEYLRKCYPDIYAMAIEEKRKKLGVIIDHRNDNNNVPQQHEKQLQPETDDAVAPSTHVSMIGVTFKTDDTMVAGNNFGGGSRN